MTWTLAMAFARDIARRDKVRMRVEGAVGMDGHWHYWPRVVFPR